MTALHVQIGLENAVAGMILTDNLHDAVVRVNYLGRSTSIILAGEAKCC